MMLTNLKTAKCFSEGLTVTDAKILHLPKFPAIRYIMYLLPQSFPLSGRASSIK